MIEGKVARKTPQRDRHDGDDQCPNARHETFRPGKTVRKQRAASV